MSDWTMIGDSDPELISNWGTICTLVGMTAKNETVTDCHAFKMTAAHGKRTEKP